MKVTIITNGTKPSVELTKKVVKDSDMVYCCDGAANWVKNIGIDINVLLGDMDSINDEALKFYEDNSIEVIKLPTEKDMTDTQYAADLAVDKGASEITFIGAMGSRFDHTLANLHVLQRLFKRGIQAKILDDKNTICVVGEGENKIFGTKGQCVSILPVGNSVFINRTYGLYYPIKNRALYIEEPLGVSNVFVENEAILDVKTGEAFIIISKD